MIQKIDITKKLGPGIRTPDYGKIYVAHPYGGEDKNAKASRRICNLLYKGFFYHRIGKGTIINPIECFAWELYGSRPFEEEILDCFRLLEGCDCLFLTGNWRDSKGCCAEYAYALAKSIPIYEIVESENDTKN